MSEASPSVRGCLRWQCLWAMADRQRAAGAGCGRVGGFDSRRKLAAYRSLTRFSVSDRIRIPDSTGLGNLDWVLGFWLETGHETGRVPNCTRANFSVRVSEIACDRVETRADCSRGATAPAMIIGLAATQRGPQCP